MFIVIVFAVRKKILNYKSGTHNFVDSIEVCGTCAKRAHEVSIFKNTLGANNIRCSCDLK